MNAAYLLIKRKMSFEDKVIGKLKNFDFVTEIQGIFGIYDVPVKFESSENQSVDRMIFTKIQKLKHIHSVQILFLSKKRNT